MRYLLDTCVLSDGAKPQKFPRLVEWLSSQGSDDFAIGSLSIGELRHGIQRLPSGRKREQLKDWLEAQLLPRFVDRVLPLDIACAEAWALLRVSGERTGRELPAIDGFLLAIAQANGLTFVTRNLADVEDRGVSVLSPY